MKGYLLCGEIISRLPLVACCPLCIALNQSGDGWPTHFDSSQQQLSSFRTSFSFSLSPALVKSTSWYVRKRTKNVIREESCLVLFLISVRHSLIKVTSSDAIHLLSITSLLRAACAWLNQCWQSLNSQQLHDQNLVIFAFFFSWQFEKPRCKH